MLKEAASTLLKERSRCPYFRILIIGRANAGKTTILEKVCGVAPGSARITYDQDGVEIGVKPGRPRLLARVRQRLRGRSKVAPSAPQVTSSMERGAHDIEHQIAYPGSNFIFHDSPGFESGANEEINNVWKFIDKRSNANELSEQLHAIWYCIPMDSPRPLLDAELQFFMKGTGKVPLVTIFTKFDAQIIQEYTKLADVEAHKDKWEQARENAENFYQEAYVSKVHETKYPPKGYVVLEDMDLPETNCPELSEKTADAINDPILHQLFVSTQMNNPDLCVKSALWDVLAKDQLSWHEVTLIIIGNFPHFWVQREVSSSFFSPRTIGNWQSTTDSRCGM
ncbi:hypothetical protein AX14_003941 [Amanita brunnescens Koide BX004]|nr:hypothetical protein AX14_003941 [Amanita brunnescens Koide BX004]